MDRIVRASGRFRDKWDEDRGGRTYGEITIQKAVDGCREVYSPPPLSPRRGIFLETVKDGLKADPRKLKDPEVLAALLTLQARDPLEFDIFANDLKEAGVWLSSSPLKKMIDGEERRQADEKAREEEGGEDGPEVSEEIKKKARRSWRRATRSRPDAIMSPTVEGNTGVAKAFIYSCSSAYMPVSDKLHADAVGLAGQICYRGGGSFYLSTGEPGDPHRGEPEERLLPRQKVRG